MDILFRLAKTIRQIQVEYSIEDKCEYITEETTFKELGIDFCLLCHLALMCANEYQILIPIVLLKPVQAVGDFIRVLRLVTVGILIKSCIATCAAPQSGPGTMTSLEYTNSQYNEVIANSGKRDQAHIACYLEQATGVSISRDEPYFFSVEELTTHIRSQLLVQPDYHRISQAIA